ncbi:MAG: HAD family phosphatase [Bacteroidetes bacterium]|nr:HAD family phosphatase [Bacteroidota bacterium]
MATIKNIIFDLGGVLLDIDVKKTHQAFEQLGIPDFSGNFYTLHHLNTLFEDLETGKISNGEFYDQFRHSSATHLSNEQIRDAWNALLLGFRESSLNFMEQLAGQYHLYLLSNTNSIHHDYFSDQYRALTRREKFENHFTKAYYSHQVKLRKPNADIYEYVLADAGINAGESLFIDDLAKNVDAANALGIQTHQLLPGERIETLSRLKII